MPQRDDIYIREKEKYTLLWNSIPQYRENSAADFLIPVFLAYFSKEIQPGERVIDFGCGVGRSTLPLLSQGLLVDLVDFAKPCLDATIFLLTASEKAHFWEACIWDLPQDLPHADWIVCFDVLEHLPEEKIEAALQGMANKMKKGGLFSIDLRKDQFGALIGEALHLTLQTKEWWQKQISAHFLILEELAHDKDCLTYALGKLKS